VNQIDQGRVLKKSDWGQEFFYKNKSRDDQVEFYRKLFCYVQLSEGENMSQAVLEAIACGIPVVSTAVGDVCDILEPEWLVDVEPELCIRQTNDIIQKLRDNSQMGITTAERNYQKLIGDGWAWKDRAGKYDIFFETIFG
jgi:glycosyltransferase involved in cell wall biosynthesis